MYDSIIHTLIIIYFTFTCNWSELIFVLINFNYKNIMKNKKKKKMLKKKRDLKLKLNIYKKKKNTFKN